MKERIYRTLNIKLSESGRVFDLLSVQFFIGLANALVNILAFTFFIYTFPVTTLPKVYLAMAGMLILLNYVYEVLEHRYPPVQLLKYVIAFSGGLLILLWLGLASGNKENFIFILLVSSVLIYMVTGYAFWGLVSLMFNVRESRRVFSIVGAGDIPAKLIGYVAAPLLIPVIGMSQVLWLAIVSLFLGLLFFHRASQHTNWDEIRKKGHEEHEEEHHKKQNLFSFFVENRLIFAISVLSLLSYNVFVLVDFTFISQVKMSSANIADLATYIAVFFAAGRLIAMAFKFIFTSRVIEKLGVIYCLFITPVALFIFCLLFFFFGENSNYNLYIFGLMAMLTEVLRSTMQEPVFFILFQPLKEKLRLKGHLISKGYMYPPSLIIVGLTLLILYNADLQVNIQLAVKILLINLCIWAAIIFVIRKNYLSAIHASIKKGIFSSEDIYINDQQTINILLNKIDTGERIEVIYALNILEKSGYPGFSDLLERLLVTEKDLDIKKYALDRMENTGKIKLQELRRLFETEQDPEIRQKAVSLLCKHDPDFVKESVGRINEYEFNIRKIIIINLLNHREFNYLFTAGNEINKLLTSGKPDERELAVDIISELKHVQFSDAIAQLIHDRDLSVKRMAISTACKLRMHSMLPSVIGLLEQAENRNIALKGLQLYGDSLFEDLRLLNIPLLQNQMGDFIKLAGRVKGKHSTAFLMKELEYDKAEPKDKILHALWIKEYEPDGNTETNTFHTLLDNVLRAGLKKIGDYERLPEFNDSAIVQRSIYNEIKYDLALALKICSLLFHKKEINRILELMEIDKHEKLYNAMEMLELMLPKKVSKDINQLFDFILDPKQHFGEKIHQEVEPFFDKVIFETPRIYNPWTRSVCIYSSWKTNQSGLLEKIKNHEPLSKEHYLVHETRDFVVQTIQKNVSYAAD